MNPPGGTARSRPSLSAMRPVSWRPRRRTLTGGALLLACGFGLSCTPARDTEVTVYAAVSLSDALAEIARTYEARSGDRVVFSFGASNILARQIEEGGRADLFLSADERTMDTLEERGLLLAGTRTSLLSNSLAIVVRGGARIRLESPRDLLGESVRRIALAEPRSVPAGIYASEYLRREGLWDRVSSKVLPAENVRAALAAVESGSAEAAIVYRTDALLSKKVRVAYDVPQAAGPRISYVVAVLKESRRGEAAQRFLAALRSPEALGVFARYGFSIGAGEQR